MITEECRYHSGRPANHNLSADDKKPVWVCCECFEKFTAAQPCCKYCGIAVKSLEDSTPKHGQAPHLVGCPRYAGEEVADGESLRSVS